MADAACPTCGGVSTSSINSGWQQPYPTVEPFRVHRFSCPDHGFFYLTERR